MANNSEEGDLSVVAVVIALFLLVTTYYALLMKSFKMPFNKLIVSYAIIIVLLITILLISRYYFTFFNTYETFIADYHASDMTYTNNKNNKNNKKNKNEHMSHLNFTNNPFSSSFNIDKMCQTSEQDKLDKNNIGWKCRVRNDFGHDAFSFETNDENKKSSIQYKFKYDGIHDVKSE